MVLLAQSAFSTPPPEFASWVKLASSVNVVVPAVATHPTTTVLLRVVAADVALGVVLVPVAVAFLSSGAEIAALATAYIAMAKWPLLRADHVTVTDVLDSAEQLGQLATAALGFPAPLSSTV